jgi:uncharacterized protein YoxC
MEIIVGVIALAFILLVIFLIMTLRQFRQVMKKSERVLTETHYLLHSIHKPGTELIENTNDLILDVKKKSEGLDVLFHPLYHLKKNKAEESCETISEVLEFVGEGLRLFSKIKNEMK